MLGIVQLQHVWKLRGAHVCQRRHDMQLQSVASKDWLRAVHEGRMSLAELVNSAIIGAGEEQITLPTVT